METSVWRRTPAVRLHPCVHCTRTHPVTVAIRASRSVGVVGGFQAPRYERFATLELAIPRARPAVSQGGHALRREMLR